jgi:hypothetical protein
MFGDAVRAGPDHEGRRAMTDLRRLQEELTALLGSWEYAFAMGHGCSIGDHPRFHAVRERAADLRALIAELTEPD